MLGFIKMSNKIFDYNLSPKALFVYTFLCNKVNCLRSTTATYQQISTACNIDSKTVKTAISELKNKGLVTKQNRFNSRGFLANRYYVKNLVQNNKSWFKIEREVFKTDIKPHDFMVFCFIRKCMCSNRHEAFPSLSTIVNITGLSRSRVSQAVKYLSKYTFINKIKRHYKRTKAWKHNRYLLFKCNVKKCKKNAHTLMVRTQEKYITYIVPHFNCKVNDFFKTRGSSYFP